MLLVLFIIDSLILLTCVALYIYAAITNTISPPEQPVRLFAPAHFAWLFTYRFSAAITGIFFFITYATVVTFIMYQGFEKTQCTEVIYFCVFLIGCLLECCRLMVPLFGLWKTSSTMLILASRTMLMGRFLAPLGMVAAAVFNETSQRQNVERNCILLLIVALGSALLYPLDTTHFTTTCSVLWGMRTLLKTMRIALYLVTIASMALGAYTKSSHESRNSVIGCAIFMGGYFVLCMADCYMVLSLGASLLVGGTAYYLRTIHSLYMWR